MRIATLRVLIVVALGLWGSLAGATKISWDFGNGSTSEHRTIWIGTQNGRIYIANPVTPALVYDEWHTYRVVVQAVTPHPGSVTVYKDNILIGTMSGLPTLWSLAETEVFVNYVDGNGVLGAVDFNNASLAAPPPAPTALTVQ